MGCHGAELGLSMYLLTFCIPAPPVYLVCNTTLCALKQPRDFCCVCVEAKEVPALLVVKMLWEELGLACCEKQSLWASGPLGEGGQVGPGWGWLEGWPSVAFHGTDCTGACPCLSLSLPYHVG